MPRTLPFRRPRRLVAALTGGALLLGVGAAFAAPGPSIDPSLSVAAVQASGTDTAGPCPGCRLEESGWALAGTTGSATAASSAPVAVAPAAPAAPAPPAASPPAAAAPTSSPTTPRPVASVAPAPRPAPAPAPALQPPAAPQAAVPAPQQAAPAAPAGRTVAMFVTGYGQPDNDPPGPAIAYPGPAPRHARTGGVGSYADPVTVAVGAGWAGLNLVPGTRLYLPRFAKYGIIEDLCATCSGRWIDVFDGSTLRDSPASVASCQERHTGTFAVEINPPPGRPENARPLIDKGVCAP